MRDDRELQIMTAIAGTVAALALVRPRLLVRLLMADPDELTGIGRFALRLFATRNLWIVARTLQGDPSAARAYLPIQALDQAVFWHAGLRGEVPRRTAALAASISGVIIVAGVRHQRRT